MKISIEIESKEIAALVLQLHGRRSEPIDILEIIRQSIASCDTAEGVPRKCE